MSRVLLASASPRRRDLLARILYPYTVIPAEIDERVEPGEAPHEYVRRLACAKAMAVSADYPATAVLGSDTAVVLDGAILGKPADSEEALRMLATLRGRTHTVLTGVAWARNGQIRSVEVVSSTVSLREASDRELEAYVATGDPLDKAGAYAIQGDAGSFVSSVDGSITNVIGLPLEETERMARALGLAPPSGPLPAAAVEHRFRSVVGEIQACAVGHGRALDSVRLITVVKGLPAALAQAAVRAGARDLGENYVQEAVAKRELVGEGPRWHLIGPLQSNKAKPAAAAFDVVHTVTKCKTALALAKHAATRTRVLVQVNVAADPAKAGLPPEEVRSLAEELRGQEGLQFEGLMTIGRAQATRDEVRRGFATLRELLEDLGRRELVSGGELSMGMSGDYDLAIAEGATYVRLGTAILGPRPEPAAGEGQ